MASVSKHGQLAPYLIPSFETPRDTRLLRMRTLLFDAKEATFRSPLRL